MSFVASDETCNVVGGISTNVIVLREKQCLFHKRTMETGRQNPIAGETYVLNYVD